MKILTLLIYFTGVFVFGVCAGIWIQRMQLKPQKILMLPTERADVKPLLDKGWTVKQMHNRSGPPGGFTVTYLVLEKLP